MREAPRDGDAGALVAVDRADHEDSRAGTGVAEPARRDRPPSTEWRVSVGAVSAAGPAG